MSAHPRCIHIVRGGFHWCGNVIIDQIIQSCEMPGPCVAIYYALCRISSDEGNKATFRASHHAIARRSWISKRSVQRHVAELARNGFILIEPGPTDSRIPNRYTLLHERLEPNETPQL